MTNTQARRVRSASWVSGSKQESTSLCYAAAEQAIHLAFGDVYGQLELAHNFMLSESGGASMSQDGATYQLQLGVMQSTDMITDTLWRTVQPHLTPTMTDILKGNRGDMTLVGRTYNKGGAPDDQQIRDTIDAGGLVAIGSSIHWKVIYGYSVSPTGARRLFVFDPWTGQSDEDADWATTLRGISTTFYVTG